jgi:cobalt-zinc-cadmium efflux system protein
VVGFLLAEAAAGVFAHSLALLADAGHMLTDAAALGAAIWALRLGRRPATARWTFGLLRAEILSAAGNGVSLLVVGVLVGVEGVLRLVHPGRVHGGVLTAVALAGLAVNAAATAILSGGDAPRSLNVTGALRHLLTDVYAFAAALVAGVAVLTTGFERADPLASLLVAALMVRASWGLLRDSGAVLLEATPEHMDLSEVRAHLLGAPHVSDVHDLHAWALTSHRPALSAHIVLTHDCFSDGHAPQVLDALQGCVAGHFDVEHSTFQLEAPGHTDHEVGAH